MAVLQKKSDTDQWHSTYSHMERENTAAYGENKDMTYLMQECCKCGDTTKWSSDKSFVWGEFLFLESALLRQLVQKQ